MKLHRSRYQHERNWAELCCLGCTCLQLFWARVVMRKWLNISAKESDFSADTEDDDGVTMNLILKNFVIGLKNRGFRIIKAMTLRLILMGSISVNMSVFQTLLCFLCTHLTSGEKEAEEIKRNADVHEIHRRTHFNSFSTIRLPKSIHNHERIIWLGDLNYRINLSNEKTRQLLSIKDWSKLVECDKLVRELRKGHAFDGWSEGTLNFPPTYKYELNSDKYYGEDPKIGKRTPAWCNRILSFGKGMRLI